MIAQIEYWSLIFTLEANDQYFGIQIQKNIEKGRKLPKITQFALFRGQYGALGKIL